MSISVTSDIHAINKIYTFFIIAILVATLIFNYMAPYFRVHTVYVFYVNFTCALVFVLSMFYISARYSLTLLDRGGAAHQLIRSSLWVPLVLERVVVHIIDEIFA